MRKKDIIRKLSLLLDSGCESIEENGDVLLIIKAIKKMKMQRGGK